MKVLFFYFILLNIICAETRVLTDLKGRSIKAKLLSKTDNKVLILRTDGREFEVDLDLLSIEDRNYIKNWVPVEPEGPSNPIDSVVTIQSGASRGTGFFVYTSGKTYVYTNQHVISDASNLKVRDSKGRLIKLGSLEVSDTQDLARFRVSSYPSFRITDKASVDEQIIVLGDSEGVGVITSSPGTILGIGSKEIEVDSDFVSGNSGGPVINSKKEVIGVATYATKGQGRPHWAKEDTRYAEVRRFIIRPSRVSDWRKVNKLKYTQQNKELNLTRYKFEQCLWTFVVLKYGTRYLVDLPSDWEKEIINILYNHNSRQKRPDVKYKPKYSNGYFIGYDTKTSYSNKEASRRANLRALDEFVEKEFGDLYELRNIILDVNYLVKGMGGADELYREIKSLRASIVNEIEISMSR